MSVLGLYRPGSTALHRVGAGTKLVVLFGASVLIVAVRGPISALVALAFAVTLAVWSGTELRVLTRTLRAIVVVAALLGGYQAWQHNWPRAVESVADLLALVLLATVLTVTTPIDEVLDTVTASLQPLRRLRVDPERVALAFSLMLRAVPSTIDLADETRDAAVARGLQRDPRARLVPLVIRVVAHARATGDALHARGIGDD